MRAVWSMRRSVGGHYFGARLYSGGTSPRDVLDKAAAQLGVQQPRDWGSVRISDVKDESLKEEVRRLILSHEGSLLKLLTAAYPGEPFLQKRRAPNGAWEIKEARREAMDGVGRWLGVEKPSDWARVTTNMVAEAGGSTLLAQYDYSLRRALEDLYPEEDAATLRPATRKRGHWAVRKNRREFLDAYATEHGIKEAAAWKGVSTTAVRHAGGGGLLNFFNGSLQEALKDAYPDEEEAWKERNSQPQGYWESKENQRAFLESLKKELRVRGPEGWRTVTTVDVISKGGRSLLHRYDGSLAAALKAVYGEEMSEQATRSWMPKRYWEQWENRKAFMDSIKEQLGVRDFADWQQVTAEDVRQRGGSGVLQAYPSFAAALADLYGEETKSAALNALSCRKMMPASFWADPENVREFLELVRRRFDISTAEDWARLSQAQIRDMNGGGLLQRMSLQQALKETYPKEDWSALASGRSNRASQRLLFLSVGKILAVEHGAQQA